MAGLVASALARLRTASTLRAPAVPRADLDLTAATGTVFVPVMYGLTAHVVSRERLALL